MDSQMQKGVLEMCLLQTIARQETYGYDLLHRMVTIFPDLQERTVYAILHRLNTGGFAETFSSTESSGPTRKYYRITQAGKERLNQLAADWLNLVKSVELTGITGM